jgi:hypothetical protein
LELDIENEDESSPLQPHNQRLHSHITHTQISIQTSSFHSQFTQIQSHSPYPFTQMWYTQNSQQYSNSQQNSHGQYSQQQSSQQSSQQSLQQQSLQQQSLQQSLQQQQQSLQQNSQQNSQQYSQFSLPQFLHKRKLERTPKNTSFLVWIPKSMRVIMEQTEKKKKAIKKENE